MVDRICASRTAHPYITGQALQYSSNPVDVPVRHDPRPVGVQAEVAGHDAQQAAPDAQLRLDAPER